MKLEEICVESFPTTEDGIAMMPVGTWMDATAGCCAPPPESISDYHCSCYRECTYVE